MPQHIFRAYDIRGVADQDLSNALFEKLGFVLGEKILRDQNTSTARVGVGRDSRPSSPRLFASLVRGLQRHSGIEIWDLGETTTPMVYFSSHHYKLDGALQITASHNPMPDNGLKMMVGQSTLSGEAIREIGKACAQLKDFDSAHVSRPLVNQVKDLRSAYLDFLHNQFRTRLKRKFKVIADCANGMAGSVLREALAPHCESLEILYEDVDCRFPNHAADPTVSENLKDLCKRVVEAKADIGIAFDGDGDRLGVVTPKGRILFGDEILMFLAAPVLRERPGAKIIGEVKCSEKLFKAISDWGGEPVMYKTGHSLIKDKMKKTGAPLAGEMSGHLFFADRFFGFDDAIYAGLRVLEALSFMNEDLDAWISKFPSPFTTPEWRVEIAEGSGRDLIEMVKKAAAQLSGVEINDIDGVRASFKDGTWFLVRTSNTQPVAVLRIESPSKERVFEIHAWLEKLLGRELPDFVS